MSAYDWLKAWKSRIDAEGNHMQEDGPVVGDVQDDVMSDGAVEHGDHMQGASPAADDMMHGGADEHEVDPPCYGSDDEGVQAEAARPQAAIEDVAWGNTAREWRNNWMIGRWADINHANAAPSLQDMIDRLPGNDGSRPVRRTYVEPDEEDDMSDEDKQVQDDVLEYVAQRMISRAEYNVSQAAFTDEMESLKYRCKGMGADWREELPKDYPEALHILEGRSDMQVFEYHVCSGNHCGFVYRLAHKEARHCPNCKTPRYKEGAKGSMHPRRRMYYVSVKGWLEKLFSQEEFAKFMQWHAMRPKCDDIIMDVYDGELFTDKFAVDPVIVEAAANDPGAHPGTPGRNIALALCTDGVQPTKRGGHGYWPIAIQCLNLPPWLRHHVKAMLLCCVINSSNAAGDIQPVMEIVVDELVSLYYQGVDVIDASCKEHPSVNIRAMLVDLRLDLPGTTEILRYVESGPYLGMCYQCGQQGLSLAGKKQIYPGVARHLDEPCHRHLKKLSAKVNNPPARDDSVPADDPSIKDPEVEKYLRNSRWIHWQPHGDATMPPMNFKESWYFQTGARRADRRLLGEPDLHVEDYLGEGESLEDLSDDFLNQSTVKASHVFYKLPYWSEAHMRGPDPMHTIGGVVGDLFALVKGDAYTLDRLRAISRFEHYVNPPDRWHGLLAKYLPEHIKKNYYPNAEGSQSEDSDGLSEDELQDNGRHSRGRGRGRKGSRGGACGRGIQKRKVSSKRKKKASAKQGPSVQAGLPWKAPAFKRSTPSARANGVERLKAMVSEGYVPSSIAYADLHNCLGNLGWLKTHDKVLLAGDIGKYALCALGDDGGASVVSDPCLKAYCRLLDAVSALWSTQIRRDKLAEIQVNLVEALAYFELSVPAWELDRLIHLIAHLPQRIKLSGPCWAMSMFPFERLWGRIDQWRRSDKHPEASILNAYLSYMAALKALGAGLESFWGGDDGEGRGSEVDDEEHTLDRGDNRGQGLDMGGDGQGYGMGGGRREGAGGSGEGQHVQADGRPDNIRNDELDRSVDFLLMPQYIHNMNSPRFTLEAPLSKGLPWCPLVSRSAQVKLEGQRLKWQLHEYYLRGEGGIGPGVAPGTTLAFLQGYNPVQPANMYADMWNQYVGAKYNRQAPSGQKRVLEAMAGWREWADGMISQGVAFTDQHVHCCQGPMVMVQRFSRASINGITFRREGLCSHRKAKGDCLIVAYAGDGDGSGRVWAGLASMFYMHRRPDAPASLFADPGVTDACHELIVDAKWFDIPSGRQVSNDHIRGYMFKRSFRKVQKDDLWPLKEVMPTQFVLAPYDKSKFILLHRAADWREREQFFLHQEHV